MESIVMNRRLSLPEKRRFLKMISFRDGGYHCLYCKILLTPRTLIFEHLNGDEYDNRIENLAFSCQSCNIKKAKGDARIERLADRKLEDNKKKYVGEKFPNIDEKEERVESSKEIDINQKSWVITEEFIRDNIMKNGNMSYQDALNSCVYLCKEKTGYGSNNTIRRHIDALSSPIGPFQIVGKGKNRMIVSRNNSGAPATS